MLKAEREHLENKVRTLSEKVKYLSTPVCKKIITIFEAKHSTLGISILGSGTVAVVAR